jgi:Zn-dependent protease with chaperone function
MLERFKNIGPIVFLLILEALFAAGITFLIWHFALAYKFGFDFTYIEWFFMIFIVKIFITNPIALSLDMYQKNLEEQE